MAGNFDLGTFLIYVLLLVIMALVIQVLLRYYLNKLFNINKKLFSYNYVNKVHQKSDWSIRIVMSIAIFYYVLQGNLKETIYVILGFAILQEVVRAFMEWKYAQNRKPLYITLIELGTFILFSLIFIQTAGFGLFKYL
ncbi:DUF4181 domain-containing protein [Oceanobacillus manasiensis]|uniref:DUF4181 domain-containing protein n=1 Tax=Oceanobacillus manasiensis TaxID=586413 RepID=UPI0006933224|nr:DUF4181 domain-containing protein [Oceanobacillus manasiensis]